MILEFFSTQIPFNFENIRLTLLATTNVKFPVHCYEIVQECQFDVEHRSWELIFFLVFTAINTKIE